MATITITAGETVATARIVAGDLDVTRQTDDWDAFAKEFGFTIDRTSAEEGQTGVRYTLLPFTSYVLMQQGGGGLIHVAIQDGEATHVAALADTIPAVDAWAAERGYIIDRDTTTQRRDGIYVSAVTRTAKVAADDLLAKAQANVQAAEVALAEAKATLALVEHAVRATR